MSQIAKYFKAGGVPALWLAASLVLGSAALPAAAQQAAAAQQDTNEQSTQHGRQVLDQISQVFESAAAKVNPSVVPIYSESKVTVQNPFGSDQLRQFFGDQFFQRYFGENPGQQERTVHALGSGVIASADGYILTNNHVVQDAQKLTVVLPNGNRTQAKVIGTDAETDLAVIKVDEKNLPAATFGDSEKVKVGEWVIAVGNPFELLHTTTAGIVSAKGRSQVATSGYQDFIQTDAAINPGNSGGALADLDGRVIGINSMISTPSGGSVGLGFAIPINLAMNVMQQLKEHGKVIRGYLGVYLQSLTQDLKQAFGIGSNVEGALIGDVVQGSPADMAGVQQGDVVTSVNGMSIKTATELQNAIAGMMPGSNVQLGILRDGNMMTLSVKLGQKPEENQQSSNEQGGSPNPQRLGISVATLTPQLAQQLGYQGEQGALIERVQPGSPAENAGLQRGDLIKEVNRRPVNSAEDLVNMVRGLKAGSTAALLVQRQNNTFFVPVQIP